MGRVTVTDRDTSASHIYTGTVETFGDTVVITDDRGQKTILNTRNATVSERSYSSIWLRLLGLPLAIALAYGSYVGYLTFNIDDMDSNSLLNVFFPALALFSAITFIRWLRQWLT